jgi:hypothetical protein
VTPADEPVVRIDVASACPSVSQWCQDPGLRQGAGGRGVAVRSGSVAASAAIRRLMSGFDSSPLRPGRVHLLIGSGLACGQCRKVRYATCAQLVDQLCRSRRRTCPVPCADGLQPPQSAVPDELGYVQIDPHGPELLSTLSSSARNVPASRWHVSSPRAWTSPYDSNSSVPTQAWRSSHNSPLPRYHQDQVRDGDHGREVAVGGRVEVEHQVRGSVDVRRHAVGWYSIARWLASQSSVRRSSQRA